MELHNKKIIKIGESYGITIPKDIIDVYLKKKCKKIWVIILEHDETPKSDDLKRWIRSYIK